MPNGNYPSEKRLKQLVKDLKREKNLKTYQAYDLISQQLHNTNWKDFKPVIEFYWKTQIPTSQVSLNFIGDIGDEERKRIELNKIKLTELGIEYSIFEPTVTGLKKSILDATQQVRTHFEIEQYHFYYAQGQGPENKVITKATLLTTEKRIKSSASLYRPRTKKGDPRMWFRNLKLIAEPGDQIAIIILDGEAFLINIAKCLIGDALRIETSPIRMVLNAYISTDTKVATELLAKLQQLAKKPFKALRAGDSAIGYTLETMLGIEANSSKLPDYKGIELKAGRGGKNRTNLFAQVADWNKSPCKKSAEILDKYGYQREIDYKLYCTISTIKPNSQGLVFKYNKANDQLEEWHESNELVAVWPGTLLRDRLIEKHAETFWIEAESYFLDGIEHFQLKSVIHTKKPIVTQLLALIEIGVITMDHLIKRNGKNNRVSEKGPLFKIDKKNLNLLFPAPVRYNLL